jgi:triphosphatase
MPGTTETELKITLRPEDLAAMEAPGRFGDLSAGEAITRHLSTTYFDTADHRLRSAGLTLRVREAEGRHEQTLKHELPGGASLLSRGEITAHLDGPEPDLARFPEGDAERLAVALDGQPLQPVFMTLVDRTSRILVSPEGDEVELALDRGEIVAGERRAPLVEVEMELRSGDLRGLFSLARTVLADVPVRLSAEPKSGRGYRLVDGGEPAPPVRAGDLEYPADASVEEVLRAALRSCLAQIAGNVLAVEAGDDPEGPHQLRVGLRRLRSALRLFRPVIDPAPAARIDGEARWLGRCVGRLRDIDVLVDETVSACAGHFDMAELTALLERRRVQERESLIGTLAEPRVGAFLLDLAAYTEGRGWLSASDLDQSGALAAPAADFAARALHKRWVKTARMGAHADRLNAEERHELRKSFKVLRYALDFLGPLIPRKDNRRLGKAVRSAQETLGYLNDVASAQSLIRFSDELAAGDTPPSRAVDRAVGFCLGWHEAEAARVWEDARDLVSLDPQAF